MKIVVETQRLVLREMEAADQAFVSAMLTHPEVMRFWPRPFTPAETEEWLSRQQDRYSRHGHGYWLAAARDSGAPLGQVGLLMTELDGVEEPALGYLLHRPFWGRGYATEAAAAVLAWAFRRGYPQVLCLVRPQNLPSLRVAVRLGLMPTRYVVYKGFDHLVFSAAPEAGPGAAHGLH
jgi:ribosomal-protein-alanine N-acetyltransferase